jgi:hypothetical protein
VAKNVAKILIITLLYLLKINLLWQTGLYDFDAVKNYLVILEIKGGDFQHLFYHGSPLFYGLMVWGGWFSTDFFFLELLVAALGMLGSLVWISFLEKEWQLNNWQSALCLLFIGTSFFEINSARYFSLESLSTSLFLIFLPNYYYSFQQKNHKYLYISALLFGLLFTLNYKTLLWLPVLFIAEISQKQRKFSLFVWLKAGVLGALAPLFFVVLGTINGLAWWRYPAVFWGIFTAPRGGQGSVNDLLTQDWIFYLQYIIQFENIGLLPGVLLAIIFYKSLKINNLKKDGLTFFLLTLVLSYWLMMSILPKAPRGLSFVYPLLYTLAGIGLLQCYHTIKVRIYKYVIISLLILSISIQIYRCQIYIYAYSQSNYELVAKYLHQQKIKKVISTVSLNLIPFAQKYNIEVKFIFDEKEIPALQKQGFEYVISDDYYKAVNLLNFNNLEKIPKLKSWAEPSLLAPMLHLEHCEFTGFSYTQAWQNQQKMRASPHQIHLIKLTTKD